MKVSVCSAMFEKQKHNKIALLEPLWQRNMMKCPLWCPSIRVDAVLSVLHHNPLGAHFTFFHPLPLRPPVSATERADNGDVHTSAVTHPCSSGLTQVQFIAETMRHYSPGCLINTKS